MTAVLTDAGAGWWGVTVDGRRVSPTGSDLWPRRESAGEAALDALAEPLRRLCDAINPHTAQLAQTALWHAALAERELAAVALGLLVLAAP